MIRKHKIAITITAVLSVLIVVFLYAKNYVTFEASIHLIKPQKPNSTYVEKEFQPANMPSTNKDASLESKVKYVSPSNSTTTVQETRFFDDVMKAVETFMPLIVTLIPIYISRRSKKRVKVADA